MDVQATWSGKYPCLCCGEWRLTVNGIDVSDKIPSDKRTEPMDTKGGYCSRYLDSYGDTREEYYSDGLEAHAWIETNKSWLDTISTDYDDQMDIFETFQLNDFRHGSCGGCI